jgi:hypothetical protein
MELIMSGKYDESNDKAAEDAFPLLKTKASRTIINKSVNAKSLLSPAIAHINAKASSGGAVPTVAPAAVEEVAARVKTNQETNSNPAPATAPNRTPAAIPKGPIDYSRFEHISEEDEEGELKKKAAVAGGLATGNNVEAVAANNVESAGVSSHVDPQESNNSESMEEYEEEKKKGGKEDEDATKQSEGQVKQTEPRTAKKPRGGYTTTVSTEESLLKTLSNSQKEEGNAAFQKGLFSEADELYTKAIETCLSPTLDMVKEARTPITPIKCDGILGKDGKNPFEFWDTFLQGRKVEPIVPDESLYTNRAAARLRLEKYAEAEMDCNVVLEQNQEGGLIFKNFPF